MQLERIPTPGIAHIAYLLADGGEAAIVDPRRDVDEYLALARSLGVTIRYVVETHRQEDLVMGSTHLAERTGAKIVNGDHELFGHGDLRLADGGTFQLGALTLRALHTPGHTPESMSWAVHAPEHDGAYAVFTGDALFFGTTGRTDLPDADRAVENAALLYDSIHGKLAGLGDGALVLPAHGPGSVCGSGMAGRPWSTLGDEKAYNDVFVLGRDEFAQRKGGERLPRPPYFRHMEKVNLQGGIEPLLRDGDVVLLDPASFDELRRAALTIDTREPEGYAAGHLPDSRSIWLGGLPAFGGWLADPDTPICLVCDRNGDVDVAVRHLARIGIDNVEAGLAGGFGSWRSSGRPIDRVDVITPRELQAERDRFQVLDVREPDEFAAGHIPGAQHCYVGFLPDRVDELGLDRDQPLAVTCAVGHRGGIATSILERSGFAQVRNVIGGMNAWRSLDLPIDPAA